MKKARVTKNEPFLKQGRQEADQYGNYTFTVTMDNNDCGYARSKDQNNSYFAVGREVEYTIEQRQGKNGAFYSISRPKTNFQGKGGYVPKTPEQIKLETRLNARSMILRYAVDVFIGGKIERAAVREMYEELIAMYDAAIDDIPLG